MTGWSVIRSSQENQQGSLWKGSRDISGLLPPFMISPTPLVIIPGGNFSIMVSEFHSSIGTNKEVMYIRVNDPLRGT